MYSNNKQPWMGVCGCVNGNWYVRQGPVLRVAWARTMMQTADVDGQVRPAGRAGRQGREKRCVWGPGPSGRPVESCRWADVTPGTYGREQPQA